LVVKDGRRASRYEKRRKVKGSWEEETTGKTSLVMSCLRESKKINPRQGKKGAREGGEQVSEEKRKKGVKSLLAGEYFLKSECRGEGKNSGRRETDRGEKRPGHEVPLREYKGGKKRAGTPSLTRTKEFLYPQKRKG